MIPARIARLLVEKHGRVRAIARATARAHRYAFLARDEYVVTHPFRWLIWTTVLAQLVGVPQSRVGTFLRDQALGRAA